ncbi:MAG: hypothetical protein IJL70_08455 [Treponema sp.]|nr:hypothetical protein [Treponema sp.]
MQNRFFGKKINFSHSGRFGCRLFICSILIFFEFFGAWASEKWSGVKNNHGEDTNYRSDSGGFTFDLTGDTQWNGNLILAADNYDVVINLNGHALYIYRLCIGWIDSSVSYKLKLIINGEGSVKIDNWQLSTYGSSSTSSSNSLTVTGNAVYSFPSNGSSYFSSGYNTSGGIDGSEKFVWTGAGSDGNWNTKENWLYNNVSEHYPGESGYTDKAVYFLGTEYVNVSLNNDITLSSSLVINSVAEKSITFTLNGNTLKVQKVILNSDDASTSNSNLFLSGSGLLECAKLDYPNEKEHTVTINEDCELKITETFYGDGISGFMEFKGDGNLSIPGSGANLNWCDGNKVKTVKYTNMKNITASCPPSYYAVSFAGAESFGTGNEITVSITKDKNGENPGSNPLNFPYKIFLTDNSKNNVFKFDSNPLTDSVDSNISKAEYSTESKSFAVNDSTEFVGLENEDGFSITFYAPDGSGLVLASVNWKKKYPTWTGSTDSIWTNASNWAGISELTGLDLSDLSNYHIVLTNGLSHYPEINGTQNITVGSLEIEGGAEFKVSGGSFTAAESIIVKGEYDFGISDVQVSGGTLTAGEIEVQGNSEFSLSGGTLQTDRLYINGNNDNRKTEFKFSGGSLTGKTGTGSYADFNAAQNAWTYLTVDSFEVKDFKLSTVGGTSPLFYMNRTVLKVNGTYENSGSSIYTKMRYSENCSIASTATDGGTWVFVGPEASDKWVYVKPVTNLTYNDVIIYLSSTGHTCIGGDIKANSIEINTSGESGDTLVVFDDCTIDSPVNYDLSQDGITFLTTYTTASSTSNHSIEFKQTVNTNSYPLKTSGEGSVKFSGAVTAGSLSAETAVTIAADMTVAGNIDFSKVVSEEGTETLTAEGNITFGKELLVSGALGLVSGSVGTPGAVTFNSTVDSVAGYAGALTVGTESILSTPLLNKSVGLSNALESLLFYGSVTVASDCSVIKTGGAAGKYAEFKGGFSGTPDILLTGNAKIYGGNTFNSFKVDNSAITRATEVLFEGGMTQHFKTSVTDGSGDVGIFKGNADGILTLSSINDSEPKWTVIFENTPTNKNFAYIRVSYSRSVTSAGVVNDLRILPKTAYIDEGVADTTENWFGLVSYKWVGDATGLWSNLTNWRDASDNTVSYLPVYDDDICKIEFASDFDFTQAFSDVLPAVTEIKLDSIKIADQKRFALAGADLSVSEMEIGAGATFALYGKSGQTVNVTGNIMAAPSSVTEYYDDGIIAVAATPLFALETTGVTKVFKKLSVKQTASGSAFNFDSAVSAKTIACTGSVSFAGSVQTTESQNYAGAVTLTGDISFKAGDSSNAGAEINFAGGVLCGGNALSVETSGNALFGNSSSSCAGFLDEAALTLTGNAEIYGDNSFSSLKIDNSSYGAETTVKFEAGKTQKIGNSFSSWEILFKGNSESFPLIVTHTGNESAARWVAKFAENPNADNFKFVKVSFADSVKNDSSGDSNPLNIISAAGKIINAGNNLNWFIVSFSYVWTGAGSDRLWTTLGNWKYAGSESASPVEEWPRYTDGVFSVKFESDFDFAQAFNGISPAVTEIKLDKVEIAEGKRFAIAGGKIIANEVSVSDGSVFALYGTQSSYSDVVKLPDSVNVQWGADCSIEYYDDGTAFVLNREEMPFYKETGSTGAKTFDNLVINQSGAGSSFKISGKTEVAKCTRIKSSAGNLVSLPNAENSFAETVYIEGGSALELNASGDYDLRLSMADSVINSSGCDSLKVSSAKKIVIESSIISARGNQEYNGAVETYAVNSEGNAVPVSFKVISDLSLLDFESSLASANGQGINFGDSGTTGSGLKVKLAGNVSGVSELHSFYETEICGNVSSSGAQNYEKTVTLGADALFSASDINFNSGIKTSGNSLSVATTGNAVFGNMESSTAAFTDSAVKAANVTIKGNAEIYGDNTFLKLILDDSAQAEETSVKFQSGKTQAVRDCFDAKGSENALLNLGGSSDSEWTLDLSGIAETQPQNITAKYLAVKNSKSIFDSIDAENSFDLGNNINWNFCGFEYEWTGELSSVWTEKSNWSPKSFPGKKSSIKISAGNYEPLIDRDIEAVKITVSQNSVLDLKAYSVAAQEIKNEGTIKIKGTSLQVVGGTKVNGAGSLIEYKSDSGETTVNPAWGSSYCNLVICSAADFTGDFAVLENLSLSTQESVKLDGNISAAAISGENINLELGESCSKMEVSGDAVLSGELKFTAGSLALSASAWTFTDFSITGTSVSVAGSVTAKNKFSCDSVVSFSGGFVQLGERCEFKKDVKFTSYKADSGVIAFLGTSKQKVESFTVQAENKNSSDSRASGLSDQAAGSNFVFADVEFGSENNTDSSVEFYIDCVVLGNWTAYREFKAVSGTVRFTGNSVIVGNNVFCGFEYYKDGGKLEFKSGNEFDSFDIKGVSSTVTFPAGEQNKQVINSRLKMYGAKEKFLVLQSATAGEYWYIDFKGNGMDHTAADVQYVNISYSYAVNQLVARESKNGHHNVNWIFPAMSISLSLSKIGSDQLYFMFDRKIDWNNSKVASTLIFMNEDGEISDLTIDTANRVAETSEYTSVLCRLNRNVTLDDLKDLYIVYRPAGTDVICDATGVTPQDYYAHTISDFAVDLITPLYGYDNRHTEYSEEQFAQNVGEGSWSIRNWNSDQGKDGTLLYGTDILISALQNESAISSKVVMFFDNKPDSGSVSTEYNAITGSSCRIWIPSYTSDQSAVTPIESFSESTNNPSGFVVNETGKKNLNFIIKKSYFNGNGIKSGDQVSFMFALEDFEVCHEPEIIYSGSGATFGTSNRTPLFAIRLKNPGDYSSIDLWSFRLKDMTLQRGGVTIVNNVINASAGEEASIKVNMTESGTLNVVVMTLDGNVVQYLHHGTAAFGDHIFSWNGTTKSGKTVARGLYFIRVFGSGIDETRKVMVVKE